MAKGQLRSNREAKKPKQVKKPDATVSSTFGGASAGTRAGTPRGQGK